MLHAYCIRAETDPGPDPGLTGLNGCPVERLDAGSLQLWVSRVAAGPVTGERLREHDRVVRAALRSATPLPLRFGTRFGSEAAARAALVESAEVYVASLERLRDRVEMSVRIAVPSSPDEAPPASGADRDDAPATPLAGSPGRAFLEKRRRALEAEGERRERADRILAGVEADLGDLALPAVRTALPDGEMIGTLAHLVHRAGLRPYRQRIQQLRSSRPDLRIALSGPWAPYSFV